MNTKIGLLAGLALVQLILIAIVVFAPGSSRSDTEYLLTFGAEEVNSLAISDGENEVELSKGADGWQVADMPADTEQLTNMLAKLADVKATWPVASSAASAERFEVSEENFQRRIRISAGATQLADLYLGTSPGYQRVHARRADSDDVFSVELSNYELGANVDAWLDKGLLTLAETPTSITVEFVDGTEPAQKVLSRDGDAWLYAGAAADQDAAQTYANRFTTLRVLGLAAAEAQASTVASITVAQDDVARVLTLSRAEQGEDYFIRADTHERDYRIATYIAEQLLMTDADFSVKEVDTVPVGDEIGES